MRMYRVAVAFTAASLCFAGCANKETANGSMAGSTQTTQSEEASSNQKVSKQEAAFYQEVKTLAKTYQDIYQQAQKDKTLDSVETKQSIIDAIGKSKISVVDTDNEINMVNEAQAEQFCQDAKDGKEGMLTMALVKDDGGFIYYELTAKDGEITISRCNLSWKDGKAVSDSYESFPSDGWDYTEKGYLMLNKYRPSGYDGAPGQIAIRVKPLDATCRQLYETYVKPISYQTNNMLITNWNETEIGDLELYDLYEKMYVMKNGQAVPYESTNQGAQYDVPKDEFEGVLSTYLAIDASVIEEKAVYNAENQTYRYRPRSLYDAEFPYEPFPEVVAFENQEDGTIKMTVDAVWTRKETDCAMRSELTVRPMEGGGFQYVSNQVVIPLAEDMENFHSDRLTDEEWNSYYGE